MDTVSSPENANHALSRREREKLAHRKEFIEAATKVFAKKGFYNATLDEIAQEAEFSKGTLYLYFTNKEDLLYSIIKDKLNPLGEILEKIFTAESSFREELRELFINLADMAFKETDFFSLIASQQAACFKTLSSEKAEEFMAMHAEFDEKMISRIGKAIEDGELRDIEPRAVHGMIHGASENMMFNRWGFETLDELKNAVDVFVDILFEGIARK